MAFKNSLLLLIIFCLLFSQPTPGHNFSKQKELVIGSRPPKCFNKCLNCKPCVAALVITQSHKNEDLVVSNFEVDLHLHLLPVPKHDAYYLLSWKCKCKDKYFQP